MATAAAQRARRQKHKRFKRCLWCPKKRAKGSTLCRECKRKHRLQRREQWLNERPAGAKQYRCTSCGELGHNSRRHK